MVRGGCGLWRSQLRNSFSTGSLEGLNLCQGAFVVFNNEESFLRCVKAYNRSKSWCVLVKLPLLSVSSCFFFFFFFTARYTPSHAGSSACFSRST